MMNLFLMVSIFPGRWGVLVIVCLNSALKETSKDLEQFQVERNPAKYKQDDKSCAFPFSVWTSSPVKVCLSEIVERTLKWELPIYVYPRERGMSCCSFYAQTLDDLNGSHQSLLTNFKCICMCITGMSWLKWESCILKERPCFCKWRWGNYPRLR